MRFQRFATMGAVLAVLFSGVSAFASSETDALIKKLVQKGILTQQEADEVKDEMVKESGTMSKTSEVETKETVKKMPGGTWLDTVKWSGDLRLRQDDQFRKTSTTLKDRHRERFRLRVGATAKPWDPLEIGFRLGTGTSGDPISNNQTFTSTFDKKAIFVDLAYAKYSPWLWVTLTGGKMSIPFQATDITWDPDTTPEGAVLQLKSSAPIPGLKEWLPIRPFTTLGAFVITENNTARDPALFAAQGGVDVDLPFGGITWQPSVAFYGFTAIKGRATSNVTNAPAGNSTSGGNFLYGYDILSYLNRIKFPDVFGKPVALVGDYVQNNAAGDNKSAWQLGTEVGKVTEKFGSWKGFYYYKRLENDATFGALTDSDFGAGGTNHKGHVFGMQFGLNKWAWLGVKYYRTDQINGAQNRNNTLFSDIQLQF